MKKLILVLGVVIAVVFVVKFLSSASRASQCNSAWDQLRGDDEGVSTLVIAMILSREHESGTVGYVLKDCILDGDLVLE